MANNNASILENFFNAKPTVTANPQENLVEFRPNPKKGQNGVYSAVIRFIPNPNDPGNKSIITKYTCWLTNPTTNERKEVDCPSTIGAPDPLQNTFFTLRNHANPICKENSKKFSRRQTHASIIQVLKCPSDPTIEGKLLVWRYGVKIYEKIENEMNPPIGEGSNPFDILNGRAFNLVCKEVSGFPNYDASQFISVSDVNSVAFHMPVNGQMIPMSSITCTTDELKMQLLNYLKTNCPDMSKYEYHEWDAATSQFVNECITIYSDPNRTITAAATAQGAVPNMTPTNIPGAMPTMSMPTAVTPQPSMSTTMSSMGMPNTGSNTELPGNISDILGGNNTPTNSHQGSEDASPNMGLAIDDILNGQII